MTGQTGLSTEDERIEIRRLLSDTLQLHVAPGAVIVEMALAPIEEGMSGAKVMRHHVSFESPDGSVRTVSLVTKDATLLERRVLATLRDQGCSYVPFNHSLHPEDDRVAAVCMEDVGTQQRPPSLEPISEEYVKAEARALASIHHANSAGVAGLPWLPRVDRQYVEDHLERYWAPTWERAIADPAFRREFGRAILEVEAAAASVADAIERLSEDERTLSLLHGDINPSNVLVVGDEPRFVDWEAACYGPFYLDLPHHLHTLTLAESYLRERMALGATILPKEFKQGYRAAARYVGLRYMWWTLDLWLEGESDAVEWVRFYLDFITG